MNISSTLDNRLIGGTQESIKASWEACQGIITIVTDSNKSTS